MTQIRRKLPPLNALRAFEASGRRLSFRAAADELGVTQGAVAQQVRGLALTSSGLAYLIDVTHAFNLLTESTARLLVQSEMVTISVTPTVAAKLLIPRLGELKEALPSVELRTVATEKLSDFDRDQVDIAVRIARPPFPSNQESRLLFQHRKSFSFFC